MRSVITFAAAALAAGIIVPHYAAQMGNARPFAAAVAARTPENANPNSVIVPPDVSGHFRVDGRHLEFMIDTGASVIALMSESAALLGIHPAQNEYRVLLKTANGTVGAAPVRLDMVEIGDLMEHDVNAVVLPEGALSDNLLGLSFLSRLRHFEFSEGKMVLEQ